MIGEAAILVAELNDVEGGAFRYSSHIAKERPGRGVEVDPDLVDAAFDGGLTRGVALAN